MNGSKLQTIINLFENKKIRSIWDDKREDYYFSVVDIIEALTDSPRARKYWNALKTKLIQEGSELSQKVGQLKMKAQDGKMRETDILDTQGIFRLIESIPSPKAEPLKNWLALLGKERIDEVFDPEVAIKRAIDYYRSRGYSDKWLESRLKGIIDRKKLTDVWKENGIKEGLEYTILTNEIYKTWSGMTAKEYKQFKGLRKESLRDNMDSIELILTDLSEEATKRIAQEKKPQGLKENIQVAKKGGNIARVAKDSLEEELGKSIITSGNNLNYQYIESEEKKLIENK